jgi:hypothetical protein
MTIVLELRGKTSHAGTTLVHESSEDVLVATVFGVLKNLPPGFFANPWLSEVSANTIGRCADWRFSFWERQSKPIGINEGSTEVDVVLSSTGDLIFIEAKLGATPSTGTTHSADRNQLIRNLDIGYRRAAENGQNFTLIFLTPDLRQPAVVEKFRTTQREFPTNPQVPPERIASRLYWSSWAQIGDTLASAYRKGTADPTVEKFSIDIMAYLAHKRLWKNSLSDNPGFYADKLLRPLTKSDSPFVPYATLRPQSDESWRDNHWTSAELIETLELLRYKDKALLKYFAQNGGAVTQQRILDDLPFIKSNSGTLRSVKSHVNATCKARNKAPIFAMGIGSGDQRMHEINPKLGELRKTVIETAIGFQIPDGVL